MNLPEEFYFFTGLITICAGLLAFERFIEWLNSYVRRPKKVRYGVGDKVPDCEGCGTKRKTNAS